MVDQERQRQDAEAQPPEERIKDERIVCNSLTTALSEAGLPTREGLAQAALHGADIPTSSEVATVPKNQIEIAQKIVNSYEFDRRRGISEFTMPTGVNDVDAMRALNAFFRQFWDSYRRDVVYTGHLEEFETISARFPNYCPMRDYSQPRIITVIGVVNGTQGRDRTIQERVQKKLALDFSDPRDQALAAAIHACRYRGLDLFQGLWVRGSVPGYAIRTDRENGVIFVPYVDDYDQREVASSGSPSRVL